jgi:Family of unknown function (DUF6496)
MAGAALRQFVCQTKQSGPWRVFPMKRIFSFVLCKELFMANHQSPAQKETVQRVMHEFKHGELKTARGRRPVKNPKQAIAIALNEAGASRYKSPQKNARNLRRTKAKERHRETYQDEAEGHRRTSRRAAGKSHRGGRAEGDRHTRARLYAEARRRGIPGRSKMDKAGLEQALHRH